MRLFNGKKMVLVFALLSIAAALIGVVATLFGLQLRQTSAFEDTASLRSTLEKYEKELLSLTEYRRFVLESKETLYSHAKLLQVSVQRSENAVKDVDPSMMPQLKSKHLIALNYESQYTFGYDLSPEKFDIRESSTGLEIHIAKPQVLAPPDISKLKYRVLVGSLTTGNAQATSQLTQIAENDAAEKAKLMAQSPEIIALCEKQLVEALSTFLQKQPKVGFVPRITVVYPL